MRTLPDESTEGRLPEGAWTMIDGARKAKGNRLKASGRHRWVFFGLLGLLYLSLVLSGHGILIWIKDTTLAPGANGPHGVIRTHRCHYFTGTRT